MREPRYNSADLFAIAEAWEAIENSVSPDDDPETPTCCATLSSAHDHGYGRGWRDGMAQALRYLTGEESP